MKIWLITIGEPLPLQPTIRKLRTAYLADELVARDHSVVWWTSAFDHLAKKWIFTQDTEISLNKNLKLIALKGCGYKKNISLSRFIDHRIIARKFKKLSPGKDLPDIMIVSLPTYDLAYEVVAYAKKHRIPVIVDIRDKWPDIFLKKIPLPANLARLILFLEFKKLKKLIQSTHYLVTVSNSFMNWALKKAGRQAGLLDKVFYLGYRKDTVDLSKLTDKFKYTLSKLHKKFVVTFIGTFEAFHDPSLLIDCAELMKADDSVQFVLAGDGKLINKLKDKAKLLPNVTFVGWLDQWQINALLEQSHIGVCTTKSNEDLFPNKAFSYLAFGLPVISAFQGDLKSILPNYEVGFYCSPNNPALMVQYINQLKNNDDFYQKMRENAFALFKREMDGDVIYKNYANHIEKVALMG